MNAMITTAAIHCYRHLIVGLEPSKVVGHCQEIARCLVVVRGFLSENNGRRTVGDRQVLT